MVFIYYQLLFFNNDNLKYTATPQGRPWNSFSLFYIFSPNAFFFYYLFSNSCTKENHVFNLYCISYILSFCYVMYYIVSSKIFIGGHFLEDCFYCYSQQIISVLTNKSLILDNFIKRAPETLNL